MSTSERLSASVQDYLSDHLAGADGALDLMDDMREAADDEDFRTVIEELRRQVAEDRDQLATIVDRLDVASGRAKRALASVGESLGRAKLARLGASNSLSRLLALETLSAGIWTKMRLWHALDATPEIRALLPDVDFDVLIERGQHQLDALEPHHQATARRALTS